MSAKAGNREARKQALALALARGFSVRAASAEAGVGERTAHSYRREAGFDELVRRYRAELFTKAVSVLAGGADVAAGALLGLLKSGEEKIVLGSARAVLAAAQRG